MESHYCDFDLKAEGNLLINQSEHINSKLIREAKQPLSSIKLASYHFQACKRRAISEIKITNNWSENQIKSTQIIQGISIQWIRAWSTIEDHPTFWLSDASQSLVGRGSKFELKSHLKIKKIKIKIVELLMN